MVQILLIVISISFSNLWFVLGYYRIPDPNSVLAMAMLTAKQPMSRRSVSILKTNIDRKDHRLYFHTQLLPSFVNNWSGTDIDVSNLILFQDKHILACFKPATILSQPIRLNNKVGEDDVSMETLMKKYLQTSNNCKSVYHGLHMLQRLDRPSSGILLFAISDLARKSLAQQFQCQSIEKRYICVVNGEVLKRQDCSDYLMKTNYSMTKVVSYTHQNITKQTSDIIPSFRPRKDVVLANLSYQPITTISLIKQSKSSKEDYKSQQVIKQTVLDVNLQSGRKHQIRAQLANQKLPIVGDMKYGATQRFALQDIALHSYYVRFCHPVTNREMIITTAPPRIWNERFQSDFKIILDSLLTQR